MRIIYSIMLFTLLASCSAPGPSTGAIQTAIAQTQAAKPNNTLVSIPKETPIPTDTPTPTPIPLAGLDLESILVQPGDLPAGFTGAQIRNGLPDPFTGAPAPVNQAYQTFEHDGKDGGGVGVALYEDSASLDLAYERLEFEGAKVPNIGEKAHLDISVLPGLSLVNIKFIRCAAVVNIQMFYSTNIYDLDSVISYAKRLDERLSELICR